MKFFNFNKDKDIAELKRRVDNGEAVKKMCETDGWKAVESLLQEQLEAYKIDNATEAKDWDDYKQKAGKIFGIQLLLTNISDFITQGQDASEELDKLNN